MVNPIPIHNLAFWLRHVMQQHCQAQDLVARDILEGYQRMIPYIINMMAVILRRFHHAVKLWQKHLAHACLINGAHFLGMGRYQELHQLCLYPLRTDVPQVPRQWRDCLLRLLLNRKAKLCRKAHGPQHPQGIFCKTILRAADTADYPFLQIRKPAEGIHQPFLRIICHCINCKISAL